MEQTVTWTEDTWTAMDDDMLGWGGGSGETLDEVHARMRQEAIKIREGTVLGTCWVPLQGIVATVACNDGAVRTVRVENLRSRAATEAKAGPVDKNIPSTKVPNATEKSSK